MVLKNGKLTYVVKGVPILLTGKELASILGIPSEGCEIRGSSKPSCANYDKHTFYYT